MVCTRKKYVCVSIYRLLSAVFISLISRSALCQAHAADNHTLPPHNYHHPAGDGDARSAIVTQPMAEAQLAHLGTQWLNQFGTAEITLSDSRPNSLLRGGSLALLLPCYQDEQQLLFTQWGISRIKGITTLNLGIGQRWSTTISGYWGYNLFYDYRLQGHHRRLGIVLEKRIRDFSLTLNGYLPLSAERLVAQKVNKVRPARGVDLRLQYAPSTQPNWRFNLTGERYFGNQVVSIGKPTKHHPTTITVGFDYTPVPLVTAGYGLKLSSGGRRTTHQLQLNFNYRLGVPLAQQLDPQQLAVSRSLEVNRLALVQRNSNIVLTQQPNNAINVTKARVKTSPALHAPANETVDSPTEGDSSVEAESTATAPPANQVVESPTEGDSSVEAESTATAPPANETVDSPTGGDSSVEAESTATAPPANQVVGNLTEGDSLGGSATSSAFANTQVLSEQCISAPINSELGTEGSNGENNENINPVQQASEVVPPAGEDTPISFDQTLTSKEECWLRDRAASTISDLNYEIMHGHHKPEKKRALLSREMEFKKALYYKGPVDYKKIKELISIED